MISRDTGGCPLFSLADLYVDHHYNPDGSLTDTVLHYGGKTLTQSYGYDAKGRLKSVAVPEFGRTVNHEYSEFNGQVINATLTIGAQTFRPRSTQGFESKVNVTLGNGAAVQQQYLSTGSPFNVNNHDAAGQPLSRFDISNAALLQVGAHSRTVLGAPDFTGQDSYSYTNPSNAYDGRLWQESPAGAGSALTYNYDAAGNPLLLRAAPNTPTWWSYSGANQLLALVDGQSQFVYDINGNPTTYGPCTLTYDDDNHLTGYFNTQTGFAAAYGYYADGKRAWKSVNGQTTYYYYDGDLLLAEFDASGNLTAYNTWGPDGLLARNSRLTSAAPQEIWYTYDALGNVAQRLDDQGDVLSTDRYDAYGNLLAGGDSSDPYGYKGQYGYYTDHDTGLILCTHRYYDPAKGRWLTEDPIGYDGGSNLYAYCDGDPVNEEDHLGLNGTWKDYFNGGDVGPPGGGESLIPIWGSSRSAIDDFQNSRYVWGVVNTGLAISDVFLIKSIVTAAGKLTVVGVKGGGSWLWKNVSKRITYRGLRQFAGQPFHHGVIRRATAQLIERRLGLAKGFLNRVVNNPLMLTAISKKMIAGLAKRYPTIKVITARMVHDALHGKGAIKLSLFERAIMGMPLWIKWATANRIIQGISAARGQVNGNR